MQWQYFVSTWHFHSLQCVGVWMGVCLFGKDHYCSTSFPDVVHWSATNLVLASWQSWLPSGINYASMWFISVGYSTQHSSLPNPIKSTSLAQPLQLSPNQIYWVCVASVSPCLQPPRAFLSICAQQLYYTHCFKVSLCKECTVSHWNTIVEKGIVSTAEPIIQLQLSWEVCFKKRMVSEGPADSLIIIHPKMWEIT